MPIKIKTSRPHPENLKEVNSVKATDGIEEFVTQLSKDIDEEIGKRKVYDIAVERLTKLRYGVRARKTRPWPGASNLSIPQIDTDINKLKPSYINLLNADPVVAFEPFGAEDIEPARLREQLYSWRLRHKVKIFKPFNYGVDMVLGPPGQTVFRIIWKFSSRKYQEVLDIDDMPDNVLAAIYDARVNDEMLFKIIQEELDIDLDYEENVEEINNAIADFREGKSKLTLDLYETDEDRPEVIACHPYIDLVVPLDTKDINDARFIDYKFWKTKNQLKIEMADGKYNTFDDSALDAWLGHNQKGSTGFSTESLTGKFSVDEMILLHETCCWYDINNDGIEERCIVTWVDADKTAILRFIELPYDHGRWPYVQVKRELTEDGFYATRGIPSLEEDFQVAISTSINQSIDNGTLLNMPERVAKKGVLSNPNNRRFIPGEFTELNGNLADYETRVLTNQTQPVLFQQAQYLKSWVDNRLSNQTVGFGQTDLPGTGERGKKTKAEIDAIIFDKSDAKSLDILVFQVQMSEVHYQIDALYDQFGPDEEEFIMTGNIPAKTSRKEVQGKFNVVPTGNLDNSNPQARFQKAMFAYQTGLGSPYVKQKELIQNVFKSLDPRLAQLLLYTDEELAQIDAQNQMMAKQQESQMFTKALQMRKISDDMDVRKEALITPITGRKYADN